MELIFLEPTFVKAVLEEGYEDAADSKRSWWRGITGVSGRTHSAPVRGARLLDWNYKAEI